MYIISKEKIKINKAKMPNNINNPPKNKDLLLLLVYKFRSRTLSINSSLILVFFTGGLFIVVYLVLWSVLPASDSDTNIKEELIDKVRDLNLYTNNKSKSLFLGGLFILLGIFALFIFIFSFDIIYKIFIPFIFIGVGIYFLITYR